MFFYHGHHLMLVLKISPIVGFVASYLCLALLGYLGGFLHSKGLTGWLLGIYFKRKNFTPVQDTDIDITRWNPLTWPINNACSDPVHKYEFSSITQAQSKQQATFQPRNKISHSYGMDLCS